MRTIIILFLSAIFISCQKDELVETTKVSISCSRDFHVTLNGIHVGNCGVTLYLNVEKGGVIEVRPDMIITGPNGAGKTTEGTAKISYNGITTSRHVSGNGAILVINW